MRRRRAVTCRHSRASKGSPSVSRHVAARQARAQHSRQGVTSAVTICGQASASRAIKVSAKIGSGTFLQASGLAAGAGSGRVHPDTTAEIAGTGSASSQRSTASPQGSLVSSASAPRAHKPPRLTAARASTLFFVF